MANNKPFGRSSGSINAPIAAFTMAIILCSYCFSSIRTARREAHSASTTDQLRHSTVPSDPQPQASWVQQALEESREAGKGKGSK